MIELKRVENRNMDLNINIKIKSPNFIRRKKAEKIDTIIIHYTGMKSENAARKRLCDPKAKVSAHYFINRKGSLWQLVEDDKVAWHAGISKWLNRINLNETSIGIELCNPGHENKYVNFTDLQYKTLESLLYILKEKYRIHSDRILGHSDIAPLRKIDPGEKFDWKRLAKKKLAVWPHKIMIPKNKTRDIYYYLSSIGYDVETDFNSVLLAFKRHFIPTDNSLVIDQKVLNIAYSVSEEFIKIRSLY